MRDERGAPVAGAEVEVAEADPLPVGARAGDDGVAHVTRLEAPPWAVTARATGFDEVTTRGVREGAPLRVVLHKLGAIAVRVVDERGEGVARARVGIASPALWPARVADCDANGAVRIGSLPAGKYALRATAGERATAIELGAIARARRGEERHACASSRARWSPCGSRVTSRRQARTTRRSSGARVTLAESGVSPFPIEATTDREGRARLGPIARGAGVARRARRGVRRAMRSPCPIRSPREVPIVLARAGAVEGRVTDARGFPVDGATIEIVGTALRRATDRRRSAARALHRRASSRLRSAGPRPLVPAGELGVMPGPVPAIPAAGHDRRGRAAAADRRSTSRGSPAATAPTARPPRRPGASACSCITRNTSTP